MASDRNAADGVFTLKRKATHALHKGNAKETRSLRSKDELKRVVDIFVQKNRASIAVPDPCKYSPYPDIPGLPNAYHMFHLHEGGLCQRKRELAIAHAKQYHAVQKSNLMGYQCNQALDYEADFASYMNTHVNNIGDPFGQGNFTVNSKFMERAVLDYYATLWRAQAPHDDNVPDSYWGFCLSMGCTEGNLYGMWNARDYLSGKKILVDDKATKIVSTTTQDGAKVTKQISVPRLVYHASPTPKDNPNAYTPIAFYSEDTHYSLAKAMTMLEIQRFYAEGMQKYPGECPVSENGQWPTEVPSYDSGAVDLEALASLVEFFAARGYPILVCFNYGTTFKGAYDDVALACNKLKPILKKYKLLEREVQYDENDPTKKDVRTGYWFHVDGALGAAYMPFIEMAFQGGLTQERGPNFDFRLPMVHSIAMSGHKWIGCPAPTGVYMSRTKYQMEPPEIPEYIGTPDTTFAGSRNGLSAMLVWDNIARHSYEDQVEKALRLLELTEYAENRLRYLQDEVLKKDLHVARTPLALTVRFKRANDELCWKYSLSNEDLDGVRFSHVFMMEHVTEELVDALVEDLSHEGAFAPDIVPASVSSISTIDSSLIAPTTNRLSLVPSVGRGFHG